MTKQADMIAYIFEGQPHLLSKTLLGWMEASPRFTAFVETNRDKIRKKIRINRERESVLDLQSELEVAYCLLNDRRLAVAYEPYASAKGRGPDFAVTYRANMVFNIEVARIRVEEDLLDEAAISDPVNIQRKEERILRILLDKLGQMQPSLPNLLVLQSHEKLVRSVDLVRLMQEVKIKAEGKDPAFYTASRYTSPASFYKDFSRLNGILFWSPEAQPWINKQARRSLPEKVLRLLSSLPP